MIQFILGILVGMIAMLGIFVFSQKQSTQRTLSKIINNPIINANERAYVAGLSDEEQSFADSLSKTKDTKLT